MDSLKIEKSKQEIAPIKRPKRLKKRQRDFIEYWCNPTSETFGNSIQSALKAGFARSTASMITSNVKNLEWLEEGKKWMDNYSPLHIVLSFTDLAHHAKQDRDKIQALDRLAKIKGMYIDRQQSEVSITFNNGVPRPTPHIAPNQVIDQDPSS